MEQRNKPRPYPVDEDEPPVQPTLSPAKYNEACQMLLQLRNSKIPVGPTAAESAYETLLEWLLEDSEKPKISGVSNRLCPEFVARDDYSSGICKNCGERH